VVFSYRDVNPKMLLWFSSRIKARRFVETNLLSSFRNRYTYL